MSIPTFWSAATPRRVLHQSRCVHARRPHARTCCSSTGRSRATSADRGVEQLVIGNAAPQKDSVRAPAVWAGCTSSGAAPADRSRFGTEIGATAGRARSPRESPHRVPCVRAVDRADKRLDVVVVGTTAIARAVPASSESSSRRRFPPVAAGWPTNSLAGWRLLRDATRCGPPQQRRNRRVYRFVRWLAAPYRNRIRSQSLEREVVGLDESSRSPAACPPHTALAPPADRRRRERAAGIDRIAIPNLPHPAVNLRRAAD